MALTQQGAISKQGCQMHMPYELACLAAVVIQFMRLPCDPKHMMSMSLARVPWHFTLLLLAPRRLFMHS